MNNAGQTNQTYVEKLSVRAPPFWSNESELWFAQLESQFLLSGIAQDSTKYAQVLSHLDVKYTREVKDIIANPPDANKYPAIKKALIERLSALQEHRTQQLLEREGLGDRKLSQFLRHLRTLAEPSVSEQMLRTLWLGRLPNQMKVILATRAQDRLEDVAEQVGRIQEISGQSVAVVSTSSIDKKRDDQIHKLSQQIAKLSKR